MVEGVRIGSGQIVYNDFPDKIDFSSVEVYEELKEDLLQIVFSNQILIDVGWYPSFQKSGAFKVSLIQGGDWDKPLFTKKTKKFQIVKETIEEYANYIDSRLNR